MLFWKPWLGNRNELSFTIRFLKIHHMIFVPHETLISFFEFETQNWDLFSLQLFCMICIPTRIRPHLDRTYHITHIIMQFFCSLCKMHVAYWANFIENSLNVMSFFPTDASAASGRSRSPGRSYGSVHRRRGQFHGRLRRPRQRQGQRPRARKRERTQDPKRKETKVSSLRKIKKIRFFLNFLQP